MARLGVPVGGRVKTLRAVEDQSAPIPREIASKLGRVSLLARCGLAWDKARLGAPGWEGEKSGLFEQPADVFPHCLGLENHSISKPALVAPLAGLGSG